MSDIIHLITTDGKEIDCTKNHPIAIIDSKGDIVWKSASDPSISKEM